MLGRILSSGAAARVRLVWEKYERFFTAGALLVGFCFDLIIATRPDSVANNVLLLVYLLVAGALIIAINIHKTRRRQEEAPADPMFLLLVLQFLFGNLSSNLLVLYGRSGTLAGSTIFIALLITMLVGNEFLKTRYGQLRFNIAVYYMLVFSYLIVAVPTFVLHDIGTRVFLITGLLSLAFIAVFLSGVYTFVLRGAYRGRHLRQVAANIGIIFAVFNIFYFLNVIPPVPLSLKEIGIYHSVVRTAPGGYTVEYEAPQWFAFWRQTSATYSLASGQPAYCFSSVFAPTGLSTPVVHSWEEYNEKTGKWETRSRITFGISGGRDGGYRGFSSKTVVPGKWRCDVETDNGLLIGRMNFTVVSSSGADLTTETL